jgi:AraC-like DNA-binding protein
MANPAPLPDLPRARVAAAYARTAVDTARALGADLAQLGAACGLPSLAAGLPEQLSVSTYMTLLDAAARQLDEPLFGLEVGRRMQLSTFAGYGLVLCACGDFRAAAEQTRRFEALAHDLGRSELIERDGVAHYRWHSPWLQRPGAPQLAESVMAGIRSFADWLAGTALPMIDVAFAHALPAGVDASRYQAALGGPARFGAAVTEARFPAAVLDARVAQADPSLFGPLARAAEQRLAARLREASEPEIVQAVREQIGRQLMHGSVRLPQVADALGLSARRLQRRLADAGSRFSTLLDATRREFAQQYLRDPELSLTEIAFLLGFAEQSAFNHAFRAWFATTPAAWRQAQR